MVAAGTSTTPPAQALVPLVIGSSLFVQLHLFLGYFLGPAARDALDRAKGPTVVVLLLAAAVGVVLWIRRRGARTGLQSAAEASCPACLALGALTPKAFRLEPLG